RQSARGEVGLDARQRMAPQGVLVEEGFPQVRTAHVHPGVHRYVQVSVSTLSPRLRKQRRSAGLPCSGIHSKKSRHPLMYGLWCATAWVMRPVEALHTPSTAASPGSCAATAGPTKSMTNLRREWSGVAEPPAPMRVAMARAPLRFSSGFMSQRSVYS